jgi:hypothetical protein
MSVKIMARVWAHSSVKGAELVVLLALADSADDDGVTSLDLAALSEKTHFAIARLQRVLDRLKVKGGLKFDATLVLTAWTIA